DPKAQIFFVTAFTDRSIEEIVQQAGGDVGYLSKPFVHEEIIQLASKGVHDWYRMTSLERLLEIIGQIGLGNSQLRSLLINILHQISDYVGTEYAVLGKRDDAGKFEEIATTGFGAERINVERFFTLITPEQSDKIGLIEGVLTCPMGNYFILAIPTRKNWFNQEKSYLLNLFMENAIRAIKNAELNESLVQKEKLSAIGQAISMVMHDIKTPIAQIQTITELIQSDPEDAEEISELAEMIEESTQHAMDIIYDVRDFVRNASLTKEPIPLTEYLEEIASEVRKKSAETAVRLEVKTSEKELIAMGDPKKLKRVMVNLINNAMEAMESHAVDDPLVTLSGHQEANQVVLTIQDNGPGIPANIQPTLFEPFVTKGKENGTGLGLAIVKQIIEAHEGEISVDSSKQGAIFTICLPK
ncbi:MAG: HAMP domain-containing sensor histidine kinase, partial [Bacteroidota bacterium]